MGRGTNACLGYLGHITKMAATLKLLKNVKTHFFQNEKAYNLNTCTSNAALNILVHYSLFE